MKFYITFFLFYLSLNYSSFSQVLVETLEGDEIALNLTKLENSTLIGNVNLSEQSLQFKALITLPNRTEVIATDFLALGIKGKPSDGLFTLFSGGNFNPSTNINLSYTKIHLFSNKDNVEKGHIDFFNIKGEYYVNKYTLFRSDTLFTNQINNFNFTGGGILFTYNLLVRGKSLISFLIGYSLKNNYSKLESIEIREFKTVIDSVTGTIREYGKVVNGKKGSYKDFENFPMRFSYTYCPTEKEDDKDKLKVGFTLYYSGDFGKFIPIHNLGYIVFLTKQNEKSGVRTSIIGIGIQANDLSNNMDKNVNLSRRLTYSLSTTFNIANL